MACNRAPVLPPQDDRVIEIVESDLWSGGEVRVVVRHADAEEAPPSILLGGEALEVTRVDDTTFAATLPVHTGELAVRVERADLAPLETTVALHGFVSGLIGPPVEGHVTGVPGSTQALMLGTAPDGLQEFSLRTGQVTRTWGADVATRRCSHGVQPGPTPGQIVLVGESPNGTCEKARLWQYGPQLTPVATLPLAGGQFGGIVVISTGSLLLSLHDQYAFDFACTAGWAACQSIRCCDFVNHQLLGARVHYGAKRAVTVAWFGRLYDLQTGEVLAGLPPRPPVFGPASYQVTGAAFSTDGVELYVATMQQQHSGGGSLHVRSASSGAVIDSVEFAGAPLAVSADRDGSRLYVAVVTSDVMALHVIDRTSLVEVARLPITDPDIAVLLGLPGNGEAREQHEVVVDHAERTVYLIGTNYGRTGPRRSSVIARWSLP